MIIAAALLIGLLTGFASAFVFGVWSLNRSRLRTAQQLEQQLGIDPAPQLSSLERIERCSEINAARLMQQTAEHVAQMTRHATLVPSAPVDTSRLN